MLVDCLAVGVGGAIGSIFRYLCGMLPVQTRDGFPVITMCINILGSFIIGLVASYALKNANFSPRLLLFLKVGLCGGFTTFSSFSLEVMGLLHNGKYLVALSYVALSVILCVDATFGSYEIVNSLTAKV